jgi:hypothetical protein
LDDIFIGKDLLQGHIELAHIVLAEAVFVPAHGVQH